MRFLESKREIEVADKYIDEAVKEAIKSPCDKSKRGVVIADNNTGEIIGRGYNRPPKDFECEPSYCKNICSSYAIHAEENAIFDALENNYKLNNSTLFHIKAVDEKPVASGGPSCVNCSKIILDKDIKQVVLKHENGYGVYESKEFHELSLKSLKSK